ncbi:MAG TPA: DUF808 domain-containing protein, partial [Rhodanobacteraceae bacterium]
MAVANLLALIDDIASVLDDVALLTKAATKKTAAVLGDDVALNAQQVAGVAANRELPIVWAAAKGSLVNKAILVPLALAISALAPWAVTPLLMIGGVFLCYEGFEKIAHRLAGRPKDDAERQRLGEALRDPSVDMKALENAKIKGAVRTDFILSAEIITIALGTVAGSAFGVRVAVLVGIALLMTIGVYGFVAGIVKLDDVGLHLARRPTGATPYLMKALSIAGTAAMFLVGGGILTHGVPALHHAIRNWGDGLDDLPGVAAVSGALGPMLVNALAGIVKLDDVGLHLARRPTGATLARLQRAVGRR